MADETKDAQPQADEPAQAHEQPEAAQDETQAPQQEPGDGLPANGVEVADAGTLRKKVTITVRRERIDAKLDEMFGELARTAQVPGFRIGRAPRRLIEKRFGREVSQDVRNALVGEAIGSAVEQTALKTLGEPDLDLDAIELPESGEMTFSFEVEVAPEFELPDLEGIPVEKRTFEVNDERIDAAMEQYRRSRARYEATSEPAAEGDTVTVEARIGGEGVGEVHRRGLTLRVAPGQVEGLPLVDLPKALAGKKAGEKATLSVRAGESHPNEQWRGKELTVELTISEVHHRVLPDLDDAFAEAAGFDSLAEMRDFVARSLRGRVETEAAQAMRQQVHKYLLDHTDFELPEGVVRRQTARVLQRRYIDLLSQGVPRERIDEHLTELQAAAGEQARLDLKLQFILAKVGEQMGVEVDEGEVNARIAQMAAAYNRRPERLRQELDQDGTLALVEVSLREEKATDRLLEQARVTEVSEAELRERMEQATRKDEQDEAPAEEAADEEAAAEEKAPPQQAGAEEAPGGQGKAKAKPKAARKKTSRKKTQDESAE